MDPVATEPRATAPLRLTRSREDRVLGGVCGGVARYLRTDPVLVRVAAVVLALVAGTGLLAYLIAWIVLPEDDASVLAGEGSELTQPSDRTGRSGATVFGSLLIAVGALLLLDRLVPVLSWRYTGPAVLVALGVLFLVRGGERR